MNNSAYLKPVDIYGVASCIGAQNVRCYSAPLVLQDLGLSECLSQIGWNTRCSKTILVEDEVRSAEGKFKAIRNICLQLAGEVANSVANQRKFLTIGGDHSCAIGTWSGAAAALREQGDIGLIWIDAHMDAHTPQTSHSGAIHGMPVASLLGYGAEELIDIGFAGAKIKPENLCLIGIRSYEPEERELLEKLGVKVFYIQDVHEMGMQNVFKEAQTHVKRNTYQYGISLDMDAIDPIQAPGVGTPASDGLDAQELIRSFEQIRIAEDFIGFELVELNSFEDEDDKTALLAMKLIEAIFK